MTLFICDDDKHICTQLKALSASHHFKTQSFTSHESLREALKSTPKPQAIMLDLVMPEGDGNRFLREILPLNVPIIALTSHKNEEAGLNAVRLGARDYLTKPLNPLRFEVALRNCLRQNAPEQNIFITHSSRLETLHAQAQKAMLDTSPLLIEGERGTGKTTLAHSLMLQSERGLKKAIEAQDLSALSLQDIYSSHMQGILLIENIEHLTKETQVLLSRLLQNNDKKAPKLILTCGFSCFSLVQKGVFIEGLYYKLAIRPLALPSFKNERADFESLAGHFHQQALKAYGGLSLEAKIDDLWQNEAISCAHSLNKAIHCAILLETTPHLVLFENDEIRPLEALEREIYATALKHYDGQMSEVARRLGVGRTTLYRKLEEFDLNFPLAPRLKIAA